MIIPRAFIDEALRVVDAGQSDGIGLTLAAALRSEQIKLDALRGEVKRILDVFPEEWYAELVKAYEASR